VGEKEREKETGEREGLRRGEEKERRGQERRREPEAEAIYNLYLLFNQSFKIKGNALPNVTPRMSGIYFWPWTLAAGLTNLRTEDFLVRVVVCKHYTLGSTLRHWVFRFGVEAHSGVEHAISTAALYEGDALTGEAAYRSAPNESLKLCRTQTPGTSPRAPRAPVRRHSPTGSPSLCCPLRQNRVAGIPSDLSRCQSPPLLPPPCLPHCYSSSQRHQPPSMRVCTRMHFERGGRGVDITEMSFQS
jgi:hypothetical protein